MEINKNNFKDFIGKKVLVEISSKFAGFLTPETNILLSFVDEVWYFKSPDEINTTEEVWMHKLEKDWSIEIHLCIDELKPEVL